MALGAAMDVRFGATVEEFMRFCQDLGLDHVEFKTEYLEGHPEAPTPVEIGDLADQYGMSLSFHAPFRDWNIGSFNDRSSQASVDQVKATLDDAATAGAGAVVVHGGDVQRRYPDWVRQTARENAIDALRECAEYAGTVGVPLCLENQPPDPKRDRHTVTPTALAETLEAVGVGPDAFRVTLDVGHANVTDSDWQTFADRFGDRIEVCHLHTNDGGSDAHHPLRDYEPIVDAVDAPYNVFEMKSLDDIAACVGEAVSSRQRASQVEW